MGHHHHKRGVNCGHGWWATSDANGHHHHKLGHYCVHGFWATDSVNGHHHHKRGGHCVEHGKWATSEDVVDQGSLTDEEFSDDPSLEYDFATTDKRSYAEIELELAAMAEQDPEWRLSVRPCSNCRRRADRPHVSFATPRMWRASSDWPLNRGRARPRINRLDLPRAARTRRGICSREQLGAIEAALGHVLPGAAADDLGILAGLESPLSRQRWPTGASKGERT